MVEDNRIYIGMRRPPVEKCGGNDFDYYHCKCMGPHIVGMVRGSNIFSCWAAGHFDEPQYLNLDAIVDEFVKAIVSAMGK